MLVLTVWLPAAQFRCTCAGFDHQLACSHLLGVRHKHAQNPMLQPQNPWLLLFLTLWPPHLEQSPPRHQALCYSLFLQKSAQDISLLRIFQLNHIVLHSHQSVQCVCVCVCIFCIIMLEHLSIYTSSFFDNIFHLDVHHVCMLVQRFEPQGRRFTSFHYYYYSTMLQYELMFCAYFTSLVVLSNIHHDTQHKYLTR